MLVFKGHKVGEIVTAAPPAASRGSDIPLLQLENILLPTIKCQRPAIPLPSTGHAVLGGVTAASACGPGIHA